MTAVGSPVAGGTPIALVAAASVSAGPGASGLRRVEQIMGTAIGIDVRSGGVPPAVVEDAFALLRDVDRAVQHVPARQRGQPADPRRAGRRRARARPPGDPRPVRGPAPDELRLLRHPAPSARRPARPDRAREGLGDRGGVAAPRRRGRGGLCDQRRRRHPRPRRARTRPALAGRASVIPSSADRIASVLEVRDLAVATSGGYERGDHIVDPHDRPAAARPAQHDRRRARASPTPTRTRPRRSPWASTARPGSTTTRRTAPTRSPLTIGRSGPRVIDSPDHAAA